MNARPIPRLRHLRTPVVAIVLAVSASLAACTDDLADEDEDFVHSTGPDATASADVTTSASPDAGTTAAPDTAMPDTAQPDTAMPDTALPDTAQPDTTQPDAGIDASDIADATPDMGPPPCVEDAECASGELCIDGVCTEAQSCSDVCDCDNGSCRYPDGDGACVCDSDPTCQNSCPCFAVPGICSCPVVSIDGGNPVCPGGQPDPMAAGSCEEPATISFDTMSSAGQAQWRGDTRDGVDVEYGCAMNTPDTGLEVVYRLPTSQLPAGTLYLSLDSDEDHWLAAAENAETYCGFIAVALGCENAVAGGGLEQVAIPVGSGGDPATDAYLVVGADGPGGEFTVQAEFVPSVCGNGDYEPGERCDGDDTGAVDCEFVNYQSGPVTCEPGCQIYDFSACVPWVQNETEPNVGTQFANAFVNPWIGSAAGGDSDWMEVEITQAGTLSAEIHPINGAYTLVDDVNTDVSIGFADAQGQFISGATYSHSIAVQPGTYYVIVNVFGAAPTFGYRVDVQRP